METTTKELNKVCKQYILDSIYCEDDNGQEVTPESDKEKLQYVYDQFKSTQQWDIDRRGEYSAFREWIMGLPSCFNIDFENYKILQLAKDWGSIPLFPTERQEDKILANWWNFITVKTFQLFRKHKIV